MKNKSLTITLIVLLSIIVILLSIFFVGILTNRASKFLNFNFGHKVSNELVIDKEYDTIFKEIKIESKASDIEIKHGNESQIKVVIYGDKEQTRVDRTNETLTIISSGKSCVGFCFNTTIARIEVYLPVDFENKVIIENNYGDIKIDDFESMTLEANLDAGDIEVESVQLATINNHYGDIKISKYSKEINIEEDCGDVDINEVENIKVVNKYGDIKIDKVTNKLNLNNNCGDIKVGSIYLKENSTIEDNLGDIEIGKTNQIYIDAKTSLGDIDIKNNYRESDITLTIKNDCGDIEVNN